MADERPRYNPQSKALVLGDGILMLDSSTASVTDQRHLAVRNAIMSHRANGREPLAVAP